MKIAHLLPTYPPEFHGGIEMYTEATCSALQRLGEECVVIAGSERRAAAGAVDTGEHAGVRVHRILRRPGENYAVDVSFPTVMEKLPDLLESERPDVAHVHHWMNLDSEIVALLTRHGIPAVVTLHDLFSTCPRFFRVVDGQFCERSFGFEACIPCGSGLYVYETHDFELELAVRELALRRELALARCVIVPSESQREFVERVLPEAARMTVLPHGNARSLPARVEPLDRPGRLRLGFWGNLVDSKGPRVLLEAVRGLGRSADLELHFWGGSPDPAFRARLEELATGLPVTFHGSFTPDDLPAIGRQIEVAVFPTLCFESYSFVLDEALLLGLPAIVSDRGALSERVGDAGWTVPAGDSVALAARIEQLLDHRDELVARGASAALRRPSTIEAHARCLRDVYREAIEIGPPSELPPERFRMTQFVTRLGGEIPDPLSSAAIDEILLELRGRYRRIIPPPPTDMTTGEITS